MKNGRVLLIVIFCFYFLVDASADPWPLGTITFLRNENCLAGYSCVSVNADCTNLPIIKALVAHKPSASITRGLVLFMPNAMGTQFFTNAFPDMVSRMEELRSNGFDIVQVRWTSTWMFSGGGNEAGMAHVGCRAATLIKYVYDNYFVPLGVPTPAPGQAGFAVVSSSGGSNQVGYALSHYGLDDYIDVAIPTGGPTFSTLAKSCMSNPEEEGYQYDEGQRSTIDRSFGYPNNNTGPCYFQNSAYLSRFLEESVATGGNDYSHPQTRVHFLIGDKDGKQKAIAGDYYQQLLIGGSPLVVFQILPGVQHSVPSFETGRQALVEAILGGPPPPPPPVPSPPDNLSASAVSSDQIDLSWSDDSDNETGFKIDRSIDGINFSLVAIAPSNSEQHSDTGLTASTEYHYRVRSYNSGGDSNYSNTASATTLPPSLPSAPGGLSANAVSDAQIDLSWTDNSNDEDGFKIERSTDGIDFSEIATVPTDATNYSDTGLLASTTYYYRVRSHNSVGDSTYSNTASDTTDALPPPPSAPSNLSASTVSHVQVSLSWTDNSTNEDGFQIERSTDGETFGEIASVAAGVTGHSDSGLTPLTTYYYRLSAYNSGGNSGYSNTISVTTSDPPSSLPLGSLTLSNPVGCPSGWNCVGFKIQCPEISSVNGTIASLPALAAVRGLAFFMPGGTGISWYTSDNPEMLPVIEELRSAGFAIVQAKWSPSWMNSTGGVEAGPATVACRPATLIQYVYENFYLPLGVQAPVPGVAGFAVTGSSGGSNQVAYALTHYGLDGIIDLAIPVGGPTFAVLAKGCLRNPGEEVYWLDTSNRRIIDRTFAYYNSTGPCYLNDPTYAQRWLEESVATGGFDYYHPNTLVHFLLGSLDILQHTAYEHYQRLLDLGTPYTIFELIPNTQHKITDTQEGRDAVKNAILGVTP